MRKIAFLAVAAFAVAVPAQAQGNPCTINSTAAAGSCTVASSFSMNMPALMQLALTGEAVTLNVPANVAAFDASGLTSTTSTGPAFRVRSNRSYKVQVHANASEFSHTEQAGAANYPKPISDVSWTTNGSTFTTLTTSAADIVGDGLATALSNAVTVSYRTNFDITKDQPGTYSLNLTFTLVAP